MSEKTQDNYNLGSSSLIESSAGTGKTFTVTFLVLRLLLGDKSFHNGTPLDIENILVVTFTNAATAELKFRILDRIHETRVKFEHFSPLCKNIPSNLEKKDFFDNLFSDLQDSNGERVEIFSKNDDKLAEIIWDAYKDNSDGEVLGKKIKLYTRLLLKAERSIDSAAISTIHGFCNRALNQIYSFEAGKAFNVQLMTEDEDIEYRKQAVVEVWRELFYKTSSNEEKASLLSFVESSDPLSNSYYLNLFSNINLYRAIDKDDPESYFGFYFKDRYKENEFYKKHWTIESRFKYLLMESGAGEDYLNEYLRLLKYICEYEPYKSGGIEALYPNLQLKTKYKPFADSLEFIRTSQDFEKTAFSLREDIEKEVNALDIKPGKISFSTKYAAKNFKDVNVPLEFESRVNALSSLLSSKKKLHDDIKTEINKLIFVKIHHKYEEICATNNVISLNDILFELAKSLNFHSKDQEANVRAKSLAELLRSKYPFALIDEFQDTDPVQYEIFNSIYFDKENKSAVCYLIGDPKQSIYRFRGSDINSYNKAKKAIIEKNGQIYSLGKNYRSAGAVVKGVNYLFAENYLEDDSDSNGYFYLQSPFRYSDSYQDNHIEFTAAEYDEKKDGLGIYFDDDNKVINNYVVDIDVHTATDKDEFNVGLKKEQYVELIARAVAADIDRCISSGHLSGSKTNILPNDICVLVHSGTESSAVISALKERNISAVYYSDRSSVLLTEGSPTEEVKNIIYLMEAICDYTNKGVLSRLYGSTLLSLSFEDYHNVIETDALDDEISLLSECYKKWALFGFSTAFFYFLKEKSIFTNLLSFENGERALTDYIHIAEIIQSIHGKIIGVNAQLLWFKEQIFGNSTDNNDSDSKKKRLESEKNLVKIYTIHSSKGLQYPVVFLPYLYSYRSNSYNQSEYRYYDPNVGHLWLTNDKERKIVEAASNPDCLFTAYELDKYAKDQEDARLTYVALTRAELANFFYIPRNYVPSRAASESAFRAMIFLKKKSDKENKNDQFQTEHLKAIDSSDEKIKSLFHVKKVHMDDFYGDRYTESVNSSRAIDHNINEENAVPAELVSPDSLIKDLIIGNNYSVSSYSSIKGAHAEHRNYKTITADDDYNFTFAKERGIKANDAGVAFHKVMELILKNSSLMTTLHVFDAKKNDSDYIKILANIIKEDFFFKDTEKPKVKLPYHQIMNKMFSSDMNSEKVDKFFEWVAKVLTSNLGEEKNSDSIMRLINLNPKSCACELEYILPSKNGSYEELNAICKEFYEFTRNELKNKFNRELLCSENSSVRKQSFKGYVKGEMDLVCQFIPQGSFYLIDYKTNFLGNKYENYNDFDIAQSIFDSRYDVQILLYSIALHRFLKNTVKGYAGTDGDAENGYDKYFGGVMYLYVRGMPDGSPENTKNHGVFFIKPKYSIIKRLDELFSSDLDK